MITPEYVGFVILTAVDIAAATIIFLGALKERMRLYPSWHKAGLILASVGLVAQAFRNVQYLVTGTSLPDADMPLWVLKDLGISLIAFGYVYLCVKGKYPSSHMNEVVQSTIKTKPIVRNSRRKK
jgi:hypothetical protein